MPGPAAVRLLTRAVRTCAGSPRLAEDGPGGGGGDGAAEGPEGRGANDGDERKDERVLGESLAGLAPHASQSLAKRNFLEQPHHGHYPSWFSPVTEFGRWQGGQPSREGSKTCRGGDEILHSVYRAGRGAVAAVSEPPTGLFESRGVNRMENNNVRVTTNCGDLNSLSNNGRAVRVVQVAVARFRWFSNLRTASLTNDSE
jgi:hypothetical protein